MIANPQQANREKWKKYIDEHRNSGLSQIEFCRQNNLSSVKFSYYKGLLKSKPKATGTFSPVKVTQPANITEIRLTLPNGFQCALPCNLDKMQIKNLIEVLLSC